MKTEPITSDLIIDDVLERWPETIEVFLKHQMSCPGCFMACYDTVGDAIQTYALERQVFLNELNQAARADTALEKE